MSNAHEIVQSRRTAAGLTGRLLLCDSALPINFSEWPTETSIGLIQSSQRDMFHFPDQLTAPRIRANTGNTHAKLWYYCAIPTCRSCLTAPLLQLGIQLLLSRCHRLEMGRISLSCYADVA